MPDDLFLKHEKTLDAAVTAIHARDYWSAYPESPSPRVYGEDAAAAGEAAFEARLGRRFEIDQPGIAEWVGDELSPYGPSLGVTYPQCDPDVLLPVMQSAMVSWRKAGIDARVGICLEMLDRINKRSFEIANAIMHTTGQGFVMSFQAGGPHAQDRGLEAIAYAYEEMKGIPETARWEKPQGKHDPIRLQKTYRIMPRGVALTVGVSTFPTWNGYPGIFASLATGNAVLIKPHPTTILPLAITAEICRDVLSEQGLDPNLVALSCDTGEQPSTKQWALRREIKIIDYTGGTGFGTWLEQNAHQAVVFTEKAGVNTVVIDGTDNFKGMCGNLAFSLSLYSGQMCTSPQDIFVPREGIETDEGPKSFDEVAAGISNAVDGLLSDPGRAAEVLGAIQNPVTADRIDEARKIGKIVRDSAPLAHAKYPDARIRSPLVLKVDGDERDTFSRELFGPIAFIVATDNTDQSIAIASDLTRSMGAITAALYSTRAAVIEKAEEAMAEAGVALSSNLIGNIFVNQSSAFSDFHATGANPAANAALTDAAFVASRFRVVQSRIPVAA
ncbi:MAG: phenylacetic acid degradation protein PaaN [Alphaproteobacteria bacterium]|nr:phenylacetic acid degradation protein PaaN [Alphaproteobacteria bacterium]